METYKLIWKGEASEVEKHMPFGLTCLYGGDALDRAILFRDNVELYATPNRRHYAIDVRGNERIAEFEV